MGKYMVCDACHSFYSINNNECEVCAYVMDLNQLRLETNRHASIKILLCGFGLFVMAYVLRGYMGAAVGDGLVSVGEYLSRMYAGMTIFRMVFILLFLVWFYLLYMVVPLIITAMVYVTMREYLAGLKRQFAGSWAIYAGGCLFLALSYTPVTNFLADRYQGIVFYLSSAVYILGYPLYFFAFRVFHKEELIELRRSVNQGRNRTESVIVFILKSVGLPVITYSMAFLIYLDPLLGGYRTWE